MAGLEAEGIIGLSPTKFHDAKSDLFIEEAFAQGQIDQKVFALSIGDQRRPSSMSIGDYDLERFATSDLHWHPLVEEHFWAINLESFKVGDTDIPLTAKADCIVDSGSSFMLMPKKEYFNMLFAL